MADYHQRWLLGDEHAGRIMETVSDTSLMDDLDARTAMAQMLLKQTGQKIDALPPLKLIAESWDAPGKTAHMLGEVEFDGSGALWANNYLAERRIHDLFGQSVQP